jgi:DNA-binding MarR family transcriptional regulator
MATTKVRGRAAAPRGGALDPTQLALERYCAAFPDADPAALEAHLHVVRAGAEMSQAITRSLEGAAISVTGPRYSLLRVLYLAEEGRMAQHELARQLGSSPANVTQLLDGLERDGLVERVTNHADRRISYAQLTGQGRAACDTLVPRMVAVMQGTVAGLTPRELASLARLLAKLRRRLKSYQPQSVEAPSGTGATSQP